MWLLMKKFFVFLFDKVFKTSLEDLCFDSKELSNKSNMKNESVSVWNAHKQSTDNLDWLNELDYKSWQTLKVFMTYFYNNWLKKNLNVVWEGFMSMEFFDWFKYFFSIKGFKDLTVVFFCFINKIIFKVVLFVVCEFIFETLSCYFVLLFYNWPGMIKECLYELFKKLFKILKDLFLLVVGYILSCVWSSIFKFYKNFKYSCYIDKVFNFFKDNFVFCLFFSILFFPFKVFIWCFNFIVEEFFIIIIIDIPCFFVWMIFGAFPYCVCKIFLILWSSILASIILWLLVFWSDKLFPFLFSFLVGVIFYLIGCVFKMLFLSFYFIVKCVVSILLFFCFMLFYLIYNIFIALIFGFICVCSFLSVFFLHLSYKMYYKIKSIMEFNDIGDGCVSSTSKSENYFWDAMSKPELELDEEVFDMLDLESFEKKLDEEKKSESEEMLSEKKIKKDKSLWSSLISSLLSIFYNLYFLLSSVFKGSEKKGN